MTKRLLTIEEMLANEDLGLQPDECIWHQVYMKDVQKYKLGDDCPTFEIGTNMCGKCDGYDTDCRKYTELEKKNEL